MKEIRFGNAAHGAAIAAAIPRRFNPACDPVISVVDVIPGQDEKLLGGVIFDGYTQNCIFVHQAGFDKRWMTRELLWVVFDYAFNQLGCRKVCGTIPSSNLDLLVFNQRLGFRVETWIRDAYPDGHMLILSMTRAECRWLQYTPQGIRSGKT